MFRSIIATSIVGDVVEVSILLTLGRAAIRVARSQPHVDKVQSVLYYLKCARVEMTKRGLYSIAYDILGIESDIRLLGSVAGAFSRRGIEWHELVSGTKVDTTPDCNTGVTPRRKERFT